MTNTRMTLAKQRLAKRLLACGVASATLAGAGAAMAADTSNGATTVNEVVVTASKRVENVQNVAGGVSVQSGEQLENRKQEQLSDYANYLPGFYVTSGGTPGQAEVSLRGISSFGSGAAIGAYLDETPMGSSSTWNQASSQVLDILPYDLDRLEVLRGPQGTLYGSGAMGGLIKYVLKPASTDQFSARIGSDVETTQGADKAGASLHGIVNLPLITDVLGVSVSLYDKYTPGYIHDAYTDASHTNADRQYGGRVALQWDPRSDLSVKFNFVESRISADDAAVESFAGTSQVPNANGADIITASHSYGDLTDNEAFPQTFRKDVTYLSTSANWNPGPVDVISATSWSRTKAYADQDQTQSASLELGLFGFPGSKVLGQENVGLDKFTQELRVVSPEANRVSWIIGGYYGYERATNDQFSLAYNSAYQLIPAFAPYAFSAFLPTKFEEYAIFGDVTWKVTDQFDLTGGLRYASNEQRFTSTGAGAFDPANPNQFPSPSNENVTTWMTSARYHLSPDTMVYARIATGYQAGAPNEPLPNVPKTVGPDTLINYEAGVKTEFLDHRALIDLTVFWIDWSKIQLSAETAGGFSYQANGGDATSKGVELASSYSPVHGLKLGFNAAYTRAQLTSVIAGAPFLTNYQLAGVPEWSLSLTADYDWTPADGWRAHVGGGIRWLDKEWLQPVEGLGGSPTIQAPAYAVVDLNGSVRKGRVTYKIYARNLSNERALQGANLEVDDFTGHVNQVDYSILQPRTIGIGVDVAY